MTHKELQEKLQETGLAELGYHVIVITVHPRTSQVLWTSTLRRPEMVNPLQAVLKQVLS